VAASGGTPRPIGLRGDVHFAGQSLTSDAIGPNGRIAVTTASNSSLFFSAGLVDPEGALSAIPLAYDGDTPQPLWTHDGHIIAKGREYYFTLWRFRPSAH
jgi:hypothetical protein